MNYTSVEQSKKLLELGISPETADLKFKYDHNEHHCIEIPMMVIVPNWDDEYNKDIPCWSLAALLGVLPPYLYEWEKGIDFNLYPSVAKKRWWCARYISQDLSPENKDKFTLITHADNPVDACVAMIIRLHEQNLL